MVNPPNNTMEITYDDRPISMYDNLNMTSNVNTTSTPKTKHQPTMTTTTPPPPTTTKTNGAAHSTPFTDIAFKFNDNNNIKQQQPLPSQQHLQSLPQQQQQLQLNGNRNLNQIPPPNTTATPLYSTPFKMANTPITKPAIPIVTTASSPLMPLPPASAADASLGNALTSSLSPSSSSPAPATAPQLTANSASNIGLHERPLSQHSQSELNETSHSIAAVKAALNEAKSKFFGLNGYAPSHDQHQQLYDPNESQTQNLLPSTVTTSDHNPRIQQQPTQQVQKPQPKYQNIPENSAIFRNQAASMAPELPPKPVEYQNLNKLHQPAAQSPMEHQNSRKMPTGTTYNQISLNDIDAPPHRTQSVYMATTVPQNMKGNKIAGRHTPTRSSLRHSRMLVVSNKHYEEIQHPNPMGFRYPTLARWLLIMQTILGILLICLSIWIFFLAPNTPLQDNPYWCGFVLLITGIIGLILIRYQRMKRDKTREHCFIFLRMDSYVLSLLSLMLCCVALIFAAIHYCRITANDTRCTSQDILVEHASCVCTFNIPAVNITNNSSNSMEALAANGLLDAEEEEVIDNSYSFVYRDLSCQEVTGDWTTILGLSFIFNTIGFLISLAYIILLACCRSATKRSYTTVRTSTF